MSLDDIKCVIEAIKKYNAPSSNGETGADELKQHIAAMEKRVQIAKQVQDVPQLTQPHQLHGKSVDFDLAVLDTLYVRQNYTILSHVYLARFAACVNTFGNLYHVNADCARYSIWVHEDDDVHRVDISFRDGVWRDSDGNPLRKWGGHIIADYGIMIMGYQFYQMRKSGEHYRLDSWVAYPCVHASVPASESVHSDKKRRAVDD